MSCNKNAILEVLSTLKIAPADAGIVFGESYGQWLLTPDERDIPHNALKELSHTFAKWLKQPRTRMYFRREKTSVGFTGLSAKARNFVSLTLDTSIPWYEEHIGYFIDRKADKVNGGVRALKRFVEVTDLGKNNDKKKELIAFIDKLFAGK